jgi:hypothetical protein
VATYGELDSIGTYCDLSATYKLTADIDASASDTENSGHGFTPIGNGAAAFTGTFHGAGHSISHLFIDDSTDSAVGLFAIVASGTIDSLGLGGSNISGWATGDSGSIGSFAGINAGGSILHCHATDDTLTGTQDSAAVGGLVGRNRGPIAGCQSRILVTGGTHGFAGGIAGNNRDTIRSSRASGSVSAMDSTGVGGVAGYSQGYMTQDSADAQVSGAGNWTFVGGLVGFLDDSLLDGLATGAVSASGFGASVGGAVGFVDTFGSITSVSATGNVSGTDSAQSMGGLAGYSRDSAASIRGCWATGSVTGLSSSNLGGLVGFNDVGGTVVSSFATGNVLGIYKSNIGGLVGQNNGLVSRGYATGKVAGSGNNTGVGGLVGWNQFGRILNGYATGHVIGWASSGESIRLGGVVGSNNDTVQNVYFAGRVDSISEGGKVYIGGAVGQSTDGLAHPQVTNAYWNTQTSGQTMGIGDSSNAGASDTAVGLTTAQMLDTANFSGFTFDPDTGWKITQNKTYPALSGLANAPFAFADSLLMDSTGPVLSRLVGNDADADTATPSLVAVVDSVFTGSLTSFANLEPGSMDTLLYRVGELRSANDTLWGGVAEATLELVRIHFALGADSLHHYGDSSFTVSATVNPSFSVVLASQNSAVASVSGTQVQPVKPGSTTLTATIGGGLVETAALRIAPKSLTITGATAQDKVYDGTTATTVTGGTLSGMLGSDTVTLVPGTWAFSTKDTGTAKPVVLSGASLTGAQAGDYALTPPSVTAKITAKTLEIVAKADTINVNDTPVLTYSDTGLVSPDALSGALASSNSGTGTAGSYSITKGTLSAGPNYSIVFTGANLVIKPGTDALAVRPSLVPSAPQELAANIGQAFASPATGSGRAELGTGPVSGGESAQTVDLLLTGPGSVSVAIYDNLGTLVISFVRDIARMDLYDLKATKDGRWILPLSWNLRAQNGIAVPTGVYLWKIDIQTLDGQKLDIVRKLGVRETR